MNTYKNPALVMVLLILVLSSGTFNAKSARQDRLRPVSLKDVLSKVGEKDRMTFLRSLVVVRGKIASAYIKDLKRSLTKSDFEALERALGWESPLEGSRCAGECKAAEGYACEPAFCVGSTPPSISLGDMISDVPETSQTEFLDSLDLREGIVIASNTKAIQKYVTRGNLRRLPQIVPLKVSECLRIGGDVVTDESCPLTSTEARTSAGALRGRFRCKPRDGGEGICIDENDPRS